jgi:hypothetical protein
MPTMLIVAVAAMGLVLVVLAGIRQSTSGRASCPSPSGTPGSA